MLNGRYELLAPIGAGGMGQVWRARDTSLGREVAVKLFVPSTSAGEEEQAQLLARFRQEARAAAGLDSPYIVAVHDHGEDDGTPYLVMALVQGRSLDQVLRESVRVPVTDALRWAADVCRALEVAHAAGVVHRDIKPGNVMITGDGTAKVVDFGIATFMERAAGDSRLTQTGQLPFGSVPYLAPERFRQEPGDGRTDLYALGCVLYELLVGRPPFTGSAAGVMYHHVNDAPLRPSRARAEVPEPVERLVLDLLAKDPADRPASAAVARGRIEGAMPAGPVLSKSPTERTDTAPSDTEVWDARPSDTAPSDGTPSDASNPWNTADTVGSVAKATTQAALPAPRRPASSRRRLLLPTALVLAVGIPAAGFGIRSVTSSDAEAGSHGPGAPAGGQVYKIGVAHSYRHAGGDDSADEYERAEHRQFTTQQLRTVKSAFTEALGAKGAGRFRIVPVTANPDTSSRELLARHPDMLAVIGDTTDFAWVHDTDEAFLPEISTCAEYAHADGAFAIPADEARQGEAMAGYLRSRTDARRVLVAEDALWVNRTDGIGTALRKGGVAVEALKGDPSEVKPARIPALVAAARADAVVIPTGTSAPVWTKRLRSDGFKGPLLTQGDPEGTCADSKDRARERARDGDLPNGTIRTRNYNGEPDDNLPARGNQELHDGATALATALENLPPNTAPTSLRHTLDREIQNVSVNGILHEISFEKRRSARGWPVWFDRRENGHWKELGKQTKTFRPTRD
ncbi:serine/threonine-protein kinase [Streptomyces luteocolor]|uniref:serine/threonine-protein kinase n=1 Tax=Streptomyces luteocolor TaxID=285500 RepID=UPI000852CD9A|nr:serine/threonine-protein kinase [Streptomyces luteocolor]